MKKIIFAACLILVLAVAIGGWMYRPIAPTHPQLTNAEFVPLIPLRKLYADQNARWRYRISPDGSKLSWLESKWFKPALWVKPLEEGSIGGEAVNIFHTDDVVRWYAWANNSRHLVYLADRDGWENDVFVSIDTSKPNAKPRTYEFGKQVKSFLYKVPQDGGANVIIAHNGRDRSRFDLYRLNLDSGKLQTMERSIEDGVSWHMTKQGIVYARTRHVNGADWRFELFENKEWRELVRGTFEDIFYPISDPDDKGKIYAVSNQNRDKSALVQIDLVSGAETIIDKNSDVDYGRVMIDAVTQKPMMSMSQPGFQKRKFFNANYEAMIGKLNLPEQSAVHIISATRNNEKLLVSVEQAHAGFETLLIDRNTNKITSISKPGIAKFQDNISKVKPVFITAKDGLKIPAFVSVPKAINKPVPMVMLIHGGPTARAYWGWSSLRVWLNNRGYAVLDVNYRASSGYGRAFREAAIGEVSRKMNQDIIDARKWAVDQKIADPKKIAVFGGSFGGLKVLTALTQNPELYAAGVDINGLSDISTMLKEVPVYWRGWPDWYRKYIGNPEKAKN